MPNYNYDDAIAITRDIHWVGFYDQKAHLHCNPYLLLDEDEVVFIDCGSIPDFPFIMRKVIDVVNPADISVVVAQHQDPDVCGNLAVVEDVIGRGDRLRVAAHTRTIRLIRHLGLASTLYAVDRNDHRLQLQSGRELRFIATPYLHAPGAIVTYDAASKSLFTSDLFGALSDGDWSLFARGDFVAGMDSWHQEYMPSNRVLRAALETLETLDIERILPQHGSVIEGKEAIAQAFAHLKALPCGLDLQQAAP